MFCCVLLGVSLGGCSTEFSGDDYNLKPQPKLTSTCLANVVSALVLSYPKGCSRLHHEDTTENHDVCFDKHVKSA